MSEPFIAEIRIFAGNFAPRGWAFCDGQILPISQNTALFALIGTIYGGDGRTTLGLPDLQGRAPMHPGRGSGLTSRRLGQRVGTETVTLTEAQIPSHSHNARGQTAAGNAGQGPDTTTSIGRSLQGQLFQTNDTSNLVNLASGTLSTTGGQAHTNLQPYLSLNFIIALVGIFPSRG